MVTQLCPPPLPRVVLNHFAITLHLLCCNKSTCAPHHDFCFLFLSKSERERQVQESLSLGCDSRFTEQKQLSPPLCYMSYPSNNLLHVSLTKYHVSLCISGQAQSCQISVRIRISYWSQGLFLHIYPPCWAILHSFLQSRNMSLNESRIITLGAVYFYNTSFKEFRWIMLYFIAFTNGTQ